MRKLNPLDEVTYRALRLSLLKNVEGHKKKNGEPILDKTVYFDGYKDGVGNPTIGIGMNLRDPVVRKFFSEWILKRYGIVKDASIELISDQINTAVAPISKFNTKSTLQSELDRIIAVKTGVPSAKCSFLIDKEVEDACAGLAAAVYEERVKQYYISAVVGTTENSAIGFSYERLALLSLSYNGGLGDELKAAIRDNNRPEAWYQIRYKTNRGKIGGLAKRRYYESQIFGLYDNPSGEVSLEEAKKILAMHSSRSKEIEVYDDIFRINMGKTNEYGSIALNGVSKVQNYRESMSRAWHVVCTDHLEPNQAKKINQISFATFNSRGIAAGSLSATDPLVIPYKVKPPTIQTQVKANAVSLEETVDDYVSTDDDTSPPTFDDDTAYYTDETYHDEDLEPVNSLLIGESPSDTFYLPSFSGKDYVVSSVSDGIIRIGGVTLSGDALQKKDSDGNINSNQWTLGRFSLIRNGNDLLIAEAGSDFSSGETSGLTIVNYPFDQNRVAFGFRLTGKVPDLAPDDSIGNPYSSRLGYNKITKMLAPSYRFPICDFYETSDGKGFFTLVAHDDPSILPLDIVNEPMSIIKFNSYGEQIGLEAISNEYLVLAGMQYNRYLFKISNPQTGKDFYVYPFDVFDDYSSDVGIRNSKVGICVIDDLGKKITSKIISQASFCQHFGECRSDPEGRRSSDWVYGCMVLRQPDENFFYISFRYSNHRYSYEQKIDKTTLENIGDPYPMFERDNQACSSKGGFYFPNGNKVILLRSEVA